MPWLPPGDRRVALTHRELQERGHAGEELQDEGLAVQDVELAARKLDGLAQLRVALVVGVHLSTWKRTWRHHSSGRALHTCGAQAEPTTALPFLVGLANTLLKMETGTLAQQCISWTKYP